MSNPGETLTEQVQGLTVILGAIVGALRVKGVVASDEITSLGEAIEGTMRAIGPGAVATWEGVRLAAESASGKSDDE